MRRIGLSEGLDYKNDRIIRSLLLNYEITELFVIICEYH